MNGESSTTQIWDNLIGWIRDIDGSNCSERLELRDSASGRGLFLTRALPPGAPLIVIPSRALLNLWTLRSLGVFPAIFEALSATQFISLHLALQSQRHAHDDCDSNETVAGPGDFFQPFLASLPKSFPTIPLSWRIDSLSTPELLLEYSIDAMDRSVTKRESSDADRERRRMLLDLLSPSVATRTLDVEKRFKADWLAVKDIWSKGQADIVGETGSLRFMDFLIAWLNVNSRCIYFDVGDSSASSADNLTLGPIIDMMNHQSGRLSKPIQKSDTLSFSMPAFGSPDSQFAVGSELVFSYGGHECPMLLAEYGFSLAPPSDGDRGNAYNHLQIDKQIIALFSSDSHGAAKQELLENNGYWGEYTASASPEPASASWRVLVALRLLHLDVSASLSSPSSVILLRQWNDILLGYRETISPENEAAVHESIRRICEASLVESLAGLERCRCQRGMIGKDERTCLDMISGIWEGEAWIAREVLKNL